MRLSVGRAFARWLAAASIMAVAACTGHVTVVGEGGDGNSGSGGPNGGSSGGQGTAGKVGDLCQEICDGCPENLCVSRCLARFQSTEGACYGTTVGLLQCEADANAPQACDTPPHSCDSAVSAWASCLSASGCSEEVANVVTETTCDVGSNCGTPLDTHCTKAGKSWNCTCKRGGSVVGTCTYEVKGCEGCSVDDTCHDTFVGCCFDLFF